MKNIGLLLIITVLSVVGAEAKIVQGQIFYADDTVNVSFHIPVNFQTQEPKFEQLQFKIRYLDSAGKKVKLKPDGVKEIRFIYGYEEIRMLSRPDNLGLRAIFSSGKNVFLRLAIDGDLKLFQYYSNKSTPGIYDPGTGIFVGGNSYTTETLILQKGDEELKQPKTLGFRKDMILYFEDCPELANKIEDRDYRKSDLRSIIVFYNNRCGKTDKSSLE